MSFKSLFCSCSMFTQIAGKFFKAPVYRINMTAQMTDDGRFKIAFQALGTITIMGNIKMLLKRFFTGGFVVTKAALELNITRSRWARLEFVVFLILASMAGTFVFSADMSNKGGLGHHGVWTMFASIALDFPMLDIDMPS